MTKEIHFLLVDDDGDDIEIFRLASQKLNSTYRITTASDGEEALKILRADQKAVPDVIFLDLNMPRMGGRQFLDEANRSKLVEGIPIIVYSTSGQENEINHMLSKGALCFITKTNSVEQLSLILSKVAEGVRGDLLASLKSISQLTAIVTCNSKSSTPFS